MTQITNFRALLETAIAQSSRLPRLADYDVVYFLGDFTGTFASRAGQIVRALDNFGGVIIGNPGEQKALRIAQSLGLEGPVNLPRYGDFLAAPPSGALVIDFNDKPAGRLFGQKLRAAGVAVYDHLYALHELDLTHTYLTVRDERKAVIERLDEYLALFDLFSDELSQQTLLARMLALIGLDLTPLLNVAFPYGVFTADSRSSHSLVIREDEVFVDVGAAHGDTVAEFFNSARGKSATIHAFEPDSVNFRALDALCRLVPGAKAYYMGLGKENSEAVFYEDENNRYGSNFKAESHGDMANVRCTTLPIRRLDDVVSEASIIKIDVEGLERDVLLGAAGLIREQRPNLQISAYHYPQDVPELITTVLSLADYPNRAIRHTSSCLYDTVLLFSDSQSFAS